MLAARDLSVNVLTNALKGVGAITNHLPQQSLGPATFDGAFSYDPATFALAVEGAFAIDGVSGQGKATLKLSDATFTIIGALAIESGSGAPPYALTNASFAASLQTNGIPRFDAQGQLYIPNVLSLMVTGVVVADGSFLLHGEGAGKLGRFLV